MQAWNRYRMEQWRQIIQDCQKSGLSSKALHYLKKQWPYLLRYLEDGRL